MITRADVLTQIVINLESGRADVAVMETFADSVDGSTAKTSRMLPDPLPVNAYAAAITQTFIGEALAFVNANRPAGAPPVTLP